ncbi:hypothetical protein IMY05_006G0129400 [Salix suchowensis]|nr:hypothetical protein IMY05_006G0129400 [Salix suchowensis]
MLGLYYISFQVVETCNITPTLRQGYHHACHLFEGYNYETLAVFCHNSNCVPSLSCHSKTDNLHSQWGGCTKCSVRAPTCMGCGLAL